MRADSDAYLMEMENQDAFAVHSNEVASGGFTIATKQ